MPRDILLALGLGVSAGILYAGVGTAAPGGVVLAYLSQVPLFAVAFASGLQLLSLALAAALLPLIAISGAGTGLVFAATVVFPVYMLSRLALARTPGVEGPSAWCPPGRLVTAMGILGAIAVVAICTMLAMRVGNVEDSLARGVARVLELAIPSGAAPADDVPAVARALAAILPGIIAVSWILMLAVNGLIAMALVNGFGRAVRPPIRISDIALPPWMVGVFGAAIALGIAVDGTLGYTARNVAVALTAPLLFQGLGVVHALVRQRTGRALPLIVFYLVLVVVSWLAAIVIVIGAIEPFARVRDRLQRRPRGGGEEDR